MNSHLDPQLVDKIVHEVKSQGVFDEFRKDSMSDVDTKPAYQNLRQRVENTVKKFLSEQRWSPEMNKNQLRERLRKHISESGFLDVGVERIVDQVVNPKIGSVFQPRIEEIAYKYLGLPPPIIKCEPPAPIMPPLPPLPMNGTPLKIETNSSSLLPTGLEQVSPDSDKATIKSEFKDEDQSTTDMEIDDKVGDDDDESPPFEPLSMCTGSVVKEEKEIKDEPQEVNNDASGEASAPTAAALIEENASQDEIMNEQTNAETQDTSASELDRDASISLDVDVVASQESHLSQVSSDSHISEVTATASHSFMDNSNAAQTTQTLTDQTDVVIEKAPVNISEEAQMPKFSENSNDTNTIGKSVESQLHFDIKKDEIKFEGTERKSGIMEHDGDCVSALEADNSQGKSAAANGDMKNVNSPCQFGNIDVEEDAIPVTTLTPPTGTPTPTPHDSSFGSSLEDTSNQDKNVTDTIAATTIAISQSDKKENNQAASEVNSSSLSSSRHKKHMKDKRRSNESKDKHREKDRDRDKERDKSKDKDKDKDKERNRDKDKNRDREKEKDRKEKDGSRSRGRDREKDRADDKSSDKSHDNKHGKSKHSGVSERSSSSSKRSNSSATRVHDSSNSKAEKNTSSKHAIFAAISCSSSRSESHDTKREKRIGDKKHHRSGSSSKKSERKSESTTDDHGPAKDKVQRRKSTDSNDEDKNCGGSGNGNNTSSSNLSNINGNDTRQQQQQNNKNSSPNSEKMKGKTKKDTNDELEQTSMEERSVTSSCNVDAPTDIDTNIDQLASENRRNKVVILNDMLQNPNINFIELGTTVKTHINSTQNIQSSGEAAATASVSADINQFISSSVNNINIDTSKDNVENGLIFFEEMDGQFSERLRLLDNAMYRCRRVVNNLRFDCAATDTCELFESEMQQSVKNDLMLLEADKRTTVATRATLTIDCIPAYTETSREQSKLEAAGPTEYYGDYSLNRKRLKRNINEPLLHEKPSPTPSDTSVNSKENMALDKNSVEPRGERRIIAANKLSQQRYSSEDLYKPRPVLSQRSRRRGVDSVI